MVVPALAGMVTLVMVPILYAVYTSLFNLDLITLSNNFIGFDNYIELLKDMNFLYSVLRTLLYVVVVVGIQFIIALGEALVLYHLPIGWAKVFRGIILLPMVLMPVASGLLWRSIMYNPPYAEIGRLLGLSESFLSKSSTAIWAVMFTDVWSWTPWLFLLMLSGLENLPMEPIEAAKIDGANFFQRLRFIILPGLSPVILVALSFKAVDCLRAFTYVWVMTQGRPGQSSHLMSTYIYENSFRLLRYGYGAAMSMAVLVFSLFVCLGFLSLLKRKYA
jgi:multiple sugar transport system permease protein